MRGGYYFAESKTAPPLTDFVARIDGQRNMGTSDGQYGLVFRYADGTHFYWFAITDDQKYQVGICNDGQYDQLIPSTKSALIRPGEKNEIMVIAHGAHYSFYINGQPAGEASDDRFKAGTVGLMSGAFSSGDALELTFDNLEVRAP